ncbi:MAG: aminopeptidase, partial [Steroidobacteraceae bacterium]
GHLQDPVLNTMLARGDAELAALIFHELAHQAAYVPGDSDFNEAFAIVVETEGLRRWLARVERPAELEEFLAARRRQDAVADAMLATRARLAAIYATYAPDEQLRRQKEAVLEELRASLAADGHPPVGVLNNARLAALATYQRCVPALTAELERLANNLPAFYRSANLLVRDTAARARLCPPL